MFCAVLSTQGVQAGTGVGRESHRRQLNSQEEVSSLLKCMEPADEIISPAELFSFPSETFMVLQYKQKMLTFQNSRPLFGWLIFLKIKLFMHGTSCILTSYM